MFSRLLRWSVPGVLGLLFLAGCKTLPTEMPLALEVVPHPSQQLVVDDVILIVDASGSMLFDAKFNTAKAATQSFVNAMPDAGYLAGLIAYGGDWQPEWVRHTPECFDRENLVRTLDGLEWLRGSSPLSEAIAPLSSAYSQIYGRSALVIFSDGKADDPQKALQTAQNLVAVHRGMLCIHTVLIGDDADGHALLEGMAQASPCGTFRHVDSLMSAGGMEGFIRQVFFGTGARGERVYTIGNEVLFDFDKWHLRREAKPVLDQFAQIIRDNPQYRFYVDAHTDSTGDEEYNLQLSVKRAHSVFMALVERGVDYKRLDPRAFGESRPRVPNDTRENRQLNRRVELRIQD